MQTINCKDNLVICQDQVLQTKLKKTYSQGQGHPKIVASIILAYPALMQRLTTEGEGAQGRPGKIFHGMTKTSSGIVYSVFVYLFFCFTGFHGMSNV